MKEIDPSGITEEQKKAQVEAMWKKHEEGTKLLYVEGDYFDNTGNFVNDELDIDFEDY
jgi:hypothetical protein